MEFKKYFYVPFGSKCVKFLDNFLLKTVISAGAECVKIEIDWNFILKTIGNEITLFLRNSDD